MNIEKIFESLKMISKKNEIIMSCMKKIAKSDVTVSELDGSLKEIVTKSISNIKDEIKNIQEIYGQYEPHLKQVAGTKSKMALKGTEEKQHDIFKLNLDKYEAFFDMILNSEVSVTHLEIFVEGYISVIYTGLQINHRKLIKPMPTLHTLLQCG